jgi:hypothetical protein
MGQGQHQTTTGSPCGAGSRCALTPALGIPQHADEHRPKGPVFLAVDQKFGEGAGA